MSVISSIIPSVTNADIESFVDLLTSEDLAKIFKNYCGYNHLMKYPDKRLNENQQLKAIVDYLTKFIFDSHPEETERPETLSQLVLSQDVDKFIDTLRFDQFFEEPLMHTANQGTADYDLSYVTARFANNRSTNAPRPFFNRN